MGLQLNLGVKYIILGTLELGLSFLKYVITHNPLNKYLLSAYYVRDPFQVQRCKQVKSLPLWNFQS